MNIDSAAFRLISYHFTKASLDFNIPENPNLNISFDPKGEYNPSTGEFLLFFEVKVVYEETEKEVIVVDCIATFKFKDPISVSDIPEFFYPNSLAILFPYVRAFVSTISLQANVPPIVLPTINLTGLTSVLKQNTISK